jgi:hypothetical protein
MKFSDHDKPNKETTTVTLRISTDIINLLHSETEQKKISLNNLIAKILNEYMEWEQYKDKIGMVCLPKPVISELFQRITDDEVIALAENIGKRAMLDVAQFMKNISDIDSFLNWFETRMKNSSVQVSRTIRNNIIYFAIKHDMGMKWSLYYKTMLESIFWESFRTVIDFTLSDGILKFNIRIP